MPGVEQERLVSAGHRHGRRAPVGRHRRRHLGDVAAQHFLAFGAEQGVDADAVSGNDAAVVLDRPDTGFVHGGDERDRRRRGGVAGGLDSDFLDQVVDVGDFLALDLDTDAGGFPVGAET